MAVFNPAAGAPVSRSVATHGLKGALKNAAQATPVTTSLALNDTVNFFYLPTGATIRSAILRASTPLDTNVSPTLTVDVGWSGTAAGLFSASLVGSAANGNDSVPVYAAIGTQFSADTLIYATVHAAGATKAAGSLLLTVEYTVDGLPS